MTDSEIIDALGGTAEVARMCNIRPPSVSEWRSKGIPAARRQFLELLRPEAFGIARGRGPEAHRTSAAPDGGAAAEADAVPVQPVSRAA